MLLSIPVKCRDCGETGRAKVSHLRPIVRPCPFCGSTNTRVLRNILGTCPLCGRVIANMRDFKDDLSYKEFKISGMCQECQDSVFGTSSLEEESKRKIPEWIDPHDALIELPKK